MANELTIFIDADTSGLRQGLAQAEREASNFQSRIQGIADVGQKMAGLGAVITAGLTVPIVALGKASITAYGEIQALQKGLESVAGSVSYAEKQFAELREVAKLPGIGLKEAVKGSINLQAIGFSADKAKETLLQFGNAIATVGKGRVEFDRAIYGISQLANTEFPLGEDLNIVADALPQVRTLLKDTFGKTRSDELKAMGVTSKQVVDVILEGLGKLPRVSGGIKNAFENLGDTMQQNLARIGKLIDDRFDISSIIDKVTNGIDKLISAFEDLSPTTQKVILGVAGVTAVAGPLLLAVGGFLALLPTLISGVTALGTAFTFLTGPIGLAVVAITAIAGSLIYYYATAEDATDRQERLNDALAKATINANKENEELKKLYSTTQDQTKSLEERNKAVDQIQKQYPAYFGNLTNEAILAGKAGDSYKQLTIDITNASRARVAQAELDKRNARRLEEDMQLQEKLTQSVKDYNSAQDRIIPTENGEIFISADKSRNSALGRNKQLLADRRQLRIDREKEDAFLLKTIGAGADAITKLEVSNIETTAKATSDAKKKAEKYVYAKGSEGYYLAEIQRLEELKKRAQFDSDVWRELSKQIENYQQLLNPTEIEPVSLKSAGFMDNFGNEYKTFVDFMSAETQRLNRVLSTDLPASLSTGVGALELEGLRLAELTADLNKDLENLIGSSISGAISDTFSSIGKAIAEGGNVIGAIGNSLLNAFSGFLSSMGELLIKYGTLAVVKGTLDEIVKTGGYQAIVAGAAAIAVGAALSFAGGALGSRANSGMTGGVSTQTGGSTGNNYTSSYTSGASQGGDTIYLRLEGRDLVTAFNRNVALNDRVNAG